MVVNVGCGMRPTEGAINVDNSFSVLLGRHPALLAVTKRLHLLSGDNIAYAEFCHAHAIRRMKCDQLQLPDHSVDVLYTSHMLEHLTRALVIRFLAEAKRVLREDGTLRISVPDMRRLAEAYLRDGDCDTFVQSTMLAYDWGGAFTKHVKALITGFRGHRWMYDADSLSALLKANGFTDIQILAPGETTIPIKTQIDLFEREEDSVYLECKPTRFAQH